MTPQQILIASHLEEIKSLVANDQGATPTLRGVKTAYLVVEFEGQQQAVLVEIAPGHPMLVVAMYPVTDGGEPGVSS